MKNLVSKRTFILTKVRVNVNRNLLCAEPLFCVEGDLASLSMKTYSGLTVNMTRLSSADESLRVCVHPGPSCCTSKMEDSYMAAVRGETQQKMRSYSFELKYLIAGHTKAYQGE